MPRTHARWLALAMIGTGLGVGACGEEKTTTPATRSVGETQTAQNSEPKARERIVLKTNVKFPKTGDVTGDVTGEILAGSRLGKSAFCVGTTFTDRHSEGRWLVKRTVRCPGGHITLGFTPREPVGDTQSGDWAIIAATGRYEGVSGSGRMRVVFVGAGDANGRETFTGIVTQ